jgi:hypothetical protein
VHGEATCALEPALVAGACEGLEERESVAGGAVAKTVALFVAVRTRLPDQFGSRDHQLFIEVVPRAGEDARSAGAPLETDPTVPRPHELPTGRSRPVGEAVVADRMSGENGRGLARECLVRLESEQGEGVAGGTVEGAQAAVSPVRCRLGGRPLPHPTAIVPGERISDLSIGARSTGLRSRRSKPTVELIERAQVRRAIRTPEP